MARGASDDDSDSENEMENENDEQSDSAGVAAWFDPEVRGDVEDDNDVEVS